jgi:hypothetical protein
VSERTEKGDSRIATRLVWMVFAPCEFAVTILIGVFLFLAWAVFIYLHALHGLFDRAVAVAVRRFRVGPISNSGNESKAAPPLSEALARDSAGQVRFPSWLN